MRAARVYPKRAPLRRRDRAGKLPRMDSDEQLLERWRAGDQASGRALFQRYFDAMHWFFATKCDEPRELAQRTFVAIVKARDQFAGRSSFRTYLYRIARNELYAHLRGLRQARKFDPESSSIVDLVTTPAAKLARNDDHQRMLEALRALPVEQQTLLELHYWEELDAQQLAEVFATTPGAIRVRLTRARAALRERMEAGPPPAAPIATDEQLDTWARSTRG
jgi:RNA polymerase sigma factor (sigma-70 family)